MAQLHSRLARRRSVRSRRTYREPDSESDFELESPNTKARPTRSSRRIETYREQTTTDDDDHSTPSSSSSNPGPLLQRQPKSTATATRRRGAARKSQRTRSRGPNQNHVSESLTLNSFKRQKLNYAHRPDGKTYKEMTDDIATLSVNVHAPPWQSLEYHILLKIMQYAAYPLYVSAFRSRPSIEWLAGLSRLCKSFQDAATAALLWEPPLLPIFRVHGLLAVLSQDQERLSINHRTKIRSLSIEVKHLLVKKSGIDIEDLLRYTPSLSHLRIYHGHDEMIGKAIWAEPTIAHFKWSYAKLFDHLDENNIRLKSFEWNGRFQHTTSAMSLAHQRPCMSSLENISIVNLNFTEKQEDERVRTRDNVISALLLLPNVKVLEFRNCTILDQTAMTQLPLGLKSLTIVNCLSLTSESIGLYLTLGGISIRTLYLEGNQVMDLGFMPKLSENCPQLESLYVDLSYEDCSSYRDRNPLFDELLPNGSPTWPSSLNSIIVGPLRSLDISDAEDFYNSLINTASDLPYLRVLSIKTILNDASWRDRAGLRMKWRPLFEKVFAVNKSYTPKVVEVKQEKSKDSKRKSARLQELEDLSTSEDIDNRDSSLLNGSILPQQNRCEIVEFELSDQRPAQEQFREDDFLDSEPSGDDEWVGRDQTTVGAGYAW